MSNTPTVPVQGTLIPFKMLMQVYPLAGTDHTATLYILQQYTLGLLRFIMCIVLVELHTLFLFAQHMYESQDK